MSSILRSSTGLFLLLCAAGAATAQSNEDKDSTKHTMVECFLDIQGEKKKEESILVEVRHDWSPLGAQRFLDLVEDDYFTDMLLYRAVEGFMVQFGVAADPAHTAKWSDVPIRDEKQWLKHGQWIKGMMSYVGTGEADSRATGMFIALGPDGTEEIGDLHHEIPFARVTWGLKYFEKNIFFGYEDDTVDHHQQFLEQGNSYMLDKFPKLNRITSCSVMDQEEFYARAQSANGGRSGSGGVKFDSATKGLNTSL